MRCSTNIIRLGLLAVLASCTPSAPRKLPIMGAREIVTRQEAGKTVVDTVYHTIPPFQFTDQRGRTFSDSTVQGHIFVADFFFVSCPSICPITSKNMLNVYRAYKDHPNLYLISHTLMPAYDTTAVLRDYADRLGVTGDTWRFLRANKLYTYTLAQKGYFTAALDDSLAPGGIEHSGLFTLVDSKRRIRGFYEGTDPKAVDQLIKDIPILLAEEGFTKADDQE